MTTTAPSPQDIVSPDVDWYVWCADGGWDSAGPGSVRDARTATRGKAAAYFASETTGYLPDVRVWKRYVRRYTRQDVWDGPGRDRWVDREEANLMSQKALHGTPEVIPPLGELFEQAPDVPPADWQPDEDDAVWQFVSADAADAIPVWVCGFKGDTPPPSSLAFRRRDASS